MSAILEDPNSTITKEDAETPSVTDIDPSPPLAVKRGQQPLNEFTENDRLFYWSFPFVFLLGRGLKTIGSMSQTTSRHLQLQFTGTAATVCRLTHLILDQYQRHANTRHDAAFLKQNPTSFAEFAKWQSETEFSLNLKEAAKHPERAKSKKNCERIMKHVNVNSNKIPFTTSARKNAMSKLLANCNYYGLPSIFLTFAPDDVHRVLKNRLSMPQHSTIDFPAEDDGFLEALKQGQTHFMEIPISETALSGMLAWGIRGSSRDVQNALRTDLRRNLRKTFSFPYNNDKTTF